jgi:LPXTG-motif cell wall-anchored protein
VPGGATAEIDNILPGTTFRVSESSDSALGYTVKYGAFWGTKWITAYSDRVEGIIPVYNPENTTDRTDSHSCVTVTNTMQANAVVIPVSKTLVNGSADPSATHTYSFTIELIKINGNDPASYNKSYSETKEVQVTGGITTDFSFAINYIGSDFFGNTTLLYKITENPPDALKSTHDATVYYATVEVTKGAKTVTLKSLKKNAENGQTVSSAAFQNILLGDLSLEKIVDGGTTLQQSHPFDFTVQFGVNAATPLQNVTLTMIKNGEPAGTVSTGTDGVVNLSGVKHGDRIELKGIPLGVVWRITENGAENYNVSWTKNGESGTSNVATGNIPVGGMEVVFTNRAAYAYELPETGGAGTNSYTMAGLVLILFSVAFLLYKSISRRREAFQSP